MYIWLICIRLAMYSIMGIFAGLIIINVWRIAKLKVVDKKVWRMDRFQP